MLALKTSIETGYIVERLILIKMDPSGLPGCSLVHPMNSEAQIIFF